MSDGKDEELSEDRFKWNGDRNICSPIQSYNDVQKLKFFRPSWQDSIVGLLDNAVSCYPGRDVQCDCIYTDLLKQRRKRSDVPKTILCHDLKGGYTEDRQVLNFSFFSSDL
jgi:hypothetical protein